MSFLDIMSCGFGAVILIYIVIHHASETGTNVLTRQLMSEATQLEYELKRDQEHLAKLLNSVSENEDEIITTEGMALEIKKTIDNLRGRIAELDTSGTNRKETIEELKSTLKKLDEETDSLKSSVVTTEDSGRNLRNIAGEGDRQYLTGLRAGGDRILVLLDVSASMLDETIVNIIRMRNMSPEKQKQSEKWKRAIRTVEWVLANIPVSSSYQIILFNDRARFLTEDNPEKWIEAKDKPAMTGVLEALDKTLPSRGTSLHAAFHLAGTMHPPPDNIFLIVDSLPTQGATPPKSTQVTAKERAEFFWSAIEHMPKDATTNTILFQMEGDPMAAPAYWQLAQKTGGSFLSPPKDWP